MRGRTGIVLALAAGLALAGCSEDWGVDQHGRPVAAEQLEGQWLVINYWAEWCSPCRSEIPQLNALAEQLQGRGVRVVGGEFRRSAGGELARASEALGIRFGVLAQDPAERLKLPPGEVLPVTYIVDAQGRLRERLLGEQNAVGLAARLQTLRGGGS
ncbi:TlpA disulfide reductase family protein [Azotobacter vinelandii]